MHSAWHPGYSFDLPEGHPFPMRKYAYLREIIAAEGLVRDEHWMEPDEIPLALLESVHEPAYVRSIVEGALDESTRKRLGFPWSEALVRRARLGAGGTLLACDAALRHGLAANLAGGTHHAFAGRGEGYCVFNDVAVALVDLLNRGRIRSAMVVDLDVHQGNGTASIFAAEPRVRTFSMHGRRNFPLVKERSTRDVELEDGTGDEEYLAILERELQAFLDAPRGPGETRADLVVYLAGVDTTADDRFGRMALSAHGVYLRDRHVLEQLAARGLATVITLGGGYAKAGARATADLHAQAHRAARDLGLG